MASLNTPICNFGWKATEFNLLGVDGKYYSLASSIGKNGILVMFICNHCPYVKAILPRLVNDVRELKMFGINTVAIMSNDSVDYQEDSFENMKKIAENMNFPFPYLLDVTQVIAKDYGAVCTPDFFGFNNKAELQYRGRFDESRKDIAPNSTRDLFNAMKQIADTGMGPKLQIPSIGCSIKWKATND